MVADAELEPAGFAVVLIMVNGHAILKPQRAEFGDVDVQAESPVVVKIISGNRISLFINGADIVEKCEAYARAVVLFKNGQAVFDRTEPVSIAANWFFDHFAKFGSRGEMLRYLNPRSE